MPSNDEKSLRSIHSMWFLVILSVTVIFLILRQAVSLPNHPNHPQESAGDDLSELIEQAFVASDRATGESKEGDAETAIKLWTAVILKSPQNAQAFFERGMMFLQNANYDSAISDYETCLTLEPDYPGARDWLGRTYQRIGDHDRAAREFEAALKTKISMRHAEISPQNWADCAYEYKNAGDMHNARRILGEYFEKYASRMNNHKDLETSPMRVFAELLLESQEFPEALRYAALAYKSKYHNPADILIYAKAAEASGDLALAKKLCAEAIKLNDQMPGLQELHNRLNR